MTPLAGCGEGQSASSKPATQQAEQIIADAKAQAAKIKADAAKRAVTTPAAAPPVTDEPAADPSSSGSGQVLPNEVGKGLQYAQDSAQAHGFYLLKSHDASGRGRFQIYDRNWKVCTQKPAAGATDTDATIDYGAVKTAESCPSSDQGTATVKSAGKTMPNLVGKSGSVAEDALPNGSVDFKDGLGQGRVVIVRSNWRVCSQSPSAGAGYEGVPVTLTVVKYGESC